MKNKKSIIILSAGISFLIITIVIVLILLGIIPNPFLDTSDLVCIRDNSNATIDEKIEEEMIFKFDNKLIIKSYEEKAIYTYLTEEEAKEQYEYMEEIETAKINLNKNVLTISNTYTIKKNTGYYGKTKKEIRKLYEEELSYECE